jgi:hypothetical protein
VAVVIALFAYITVIVKKHASNSTKSEERGVLFAKLESIGYTINARN